MKKKSVVYMAVTTDKYETPLIVTDDVSVLEEKFGVTRNRIYSSISHGYGGRRAGFRFVRVDLGEE